MASLRVAVKGDPATKTLLDCEPGADNEVLNAQP
jgi:hypothetical protein